MYSLARTKALAVAMIVAGVAAMVPARSPFQASQTKELTSSISGRVTIGGVPGRGVAVLLTSSENGQFERPLAKATTDQDGRFHLTGVPAGQHLLNAFAPALVALSGNMMWRSGKVINITAGEALEGEDIALTRGAAITGRVSDADGQPIIQENVRLFVVSEQGRKVQIYLPFGSFAPSATDDRGVFRLFGVPPGRYILAVGVDPGAPIGRMASGNTYYPVTYHPDVSDEAKATVIEVAAGSEATGVDIVLGRASKAYSASGRIIDADTGKPIVAMQYGCSSLDPQGRQVYSTSSSGSTSGARGEFRIDGLAPGPYSAYAVPNADSEVYSELAPFTVSGNDVAGLEIKVHRGSSIIGNVVIEGAEGQRGAPRLSDVRVGISSGSLNVAPRSGLLSIAPDGSFRAAGLPRGIANFSVFTYPANKWLSLVRVERDGVEQKNGIEIGLAEEITGVKVVFAYGTGAIRGQVQIKGEEIPAGAFMFLSLRRIGAVLHQGRMPPLPDSRGRFAIDGLPPGEYELSLTFQGRAVDGNTQLNSKSVKQTVTVTNGAETQVTMVVDLNEKNQ
ncbi:MAG TPA: carboxypeptidase-like regulatory domain-containing protein [Blastocatellia bacterium]|nr:carboxypeptidase-like regulatory domain-containing protein [Blastocatellia bacterium]